MGTVPTVTVWSAGQFVTSTQMNTIGTGLSFLLTPPQAGVYSNAAHSWSSLSTPTVNGQWNTALVNTDNNWVSGTASRLVCNTAGRYSIEGAVHFTAATAAGPMQIGVASNAAGTWPAAGSTSRLQEETKTAIGVTQFGNSLNTSFTTYLNVGDYIELFLAQFSGTSYTIFPNGTYFDGHFYFRWVSSA